MKKKAASTDGALENKLLTVFIESTEIHLTGIWEWDMYADAVYCSDVMLAYPSDFLGTKGIIHPEDLPQVKKALEAVNAQKSSVFDFRLITTYGEIKAIRGEQIVALNQEAPFYTSTLLHHAEQKQEEDRFKTIKKVYDRFERLHDYGVWYTNPATNETWYSDQVYRIHGLPPQGLNAHPDTFMPFVHTADVNAVRDAFDRAVAAQLPLHLHYRIITPGGEERTVQQVTQWEFNDRGQLILTGILQDITEKRFNEYELELSRHTYDFQQSLLKHAEQVSNTGTWHINLLTRKVVFSDNFFRLYGLKPGTVAASSNFLANYIHPDDRELVMETVFKMKSHHTPPDIEYRVVRADGKIRFLKLKGKQLVYANSELVIGGILQDVTVQKSLEKKVADVTEDLMVRNFAYRQTEEMAGMGSWLWNIASGKIIWSENIYHLLGYKPNAVQLTHQHLTRATHPDDRKKVSDTLTLMLTERLESELQFRIIRMGEEVHVKARFRLMKYEDKHYFIGTIQDITEQSKMQQDLLARIQIAELLSENIPDAVFISDLDNNIIFWNKKAEDQYRIKKEQSLNKNYFDLFPQMMESNVTDNINKVLQGEAVHKKNQPFLHNQYFDLHLLPLLNEEKDVIGVLHVHHETTKEVALQVNVEERISFIENLINNSVDRIIALDKHMNYLYWNSQCEAHYSIKKEDIIGKNILEVFPGEVPVLSYDHFRKALKGETVHLSSGEEDTELLETYLIPIKDERENVKAVLWIMHDVSKELLLKKEQRRAQTILNSINEACIELDENGTIIYANAKVGEFWGSATENFVHQNIWTVFPEGVDSPLYFAINYVIQEKQPVNQEFLSPFTGRWVYLTSTPTDKGVVVLFFDIHETKLADERLELEHRRLEEAQAIGHIGNFEWDVQTGTIYWSDEMYRIHGLEPQSEVITLDRLLSFIPAREHAAIDELIKLRQTPRVINLVHSIIKENGERRVVRRIAQSFANENGQVTHLSGTMQDITEYTKAEEQLRRSEALLRSAEEVAATGSYEAELLTNILRFSDGMYRLFGEEPGAFEPSMDWINAHSHPDDIEPVSRILEQAVTDKKPYHYIRRIYRKDGALRTIEAHGNVLTDDAGNAIKFIGLVQDITERKGAEEEIKKNQELLKTTIDSVPDMIQVFESVRDESGEIVDFRYVLLNQEAERWMPDVIGKTMLQLQPGVAEEGIFDAFRQVVETGIPQQYEKHYVHEQFNGWFYQSVVKLNDGVTTTTANITDRKIAQQELLRAEEELAKRATDRYNDLFHSIEQGFCTIAVKYDETDQPIDYQFIEVSPSFEQQTGIKNGAGKWMREIAENQDEFWFETYGRIAKERKAERFEYCSTPLDRWFSVYAFPIDDPADRRIGVLFNDITERKRSEQRQEYLLQLSDSLRTLKDPVAMQETTSRLLGEYLQTDRAYYVEINEAAGEFVVAADWHQPDAISHARPYPMEDWLMPWLLNGKTWVVSDTDTDPAMPDNQREIYKGNDIRAAVVVPLIRNGKLVATFCTNQRTPREWRKEEIELVEETAVRIWTSLELGYAEQSLRQSEERLQKALSIETVGVIYFDLDGGIHDCNPAFERMSGFSKEEFIKGNVRWDALTPSEFMEVTLRSREEFLATGQNTPYEKQYIRPDGSRWWGLFAGKRLSDTECVEFVVDITEQKEAGESLKDSALRLEQEVAERTSEIKKNNEELAKNLAILQHTEEIAQIGSWEYEIATGRFDWSPGMFRLFGVKPGVKVTPEMYIDFSIEEDRSVAKRIVKNLRKQHKPFEEVMRIRAGSATKLLKIKSSVVADEAGQPQKIIGIDLDITDLKNAEEKIAETELWLHHTTDSSPDSISVFDLEKKQPVYLNNCLAHWLGTTNEELVAMGLNGRLKMVHPDDRLNLLHFNEKVIQADGKVLKMEYRLITLNDKTIWIRNRSKLFMKNNAGKATHLLTYLQDVTEEVLLRQQLTMRINYAENLIDASLDRMLVIDPAKNIIGWNKRCEETYHARRQEVIGKNFFEVFSKLAGDELIIKGMEQCLKGEVVRLPVRKEIYNPSYSEIFYIPLKDEKGDVYAILNVLHDITKAFLVKEELKEVNKTLEQKNLELESKNEQITSFAFIASHDLREPLRKIHTFSDWLLTKECASLSDHGKDYLERLNQSVKRLSLLIDDILALTQIHAAREAVEEINLNEVLEEVKNEMHDWIEQHKGIISSHQLHSIKGFRKQLSFLFKNLLSNAIKFHKEGDKPELQIISEIADSAELPLQYRDEREYIKLSFIDNGIGIDERYKKKIFLMFQRLQANKQIEGTGMGLTMCKKIMENHQGYITVESEEGKGSAFHCYFPLL